MPELGPSGSVRGAVSNHRPYRDPEHLQQVALQLLDHLVGDREQRRWNFEGASPHYRVLFGHF
jgi:hypothetical protein